MSAPKTTSWQLFCKNNFIIGESEFFLGLYCSSVPFTRISLVFADFPEKFYLIFPPQISTWDLLIPLGNSYCYFFSKEVPFLRIQEYILEFFLECLFQNKSSLRDKKLARDKNNKELQN